MNPVLNRHGARLTAWLVCLAAAAAQGQTLAPPLKVVTLSATASVEVNKDWLTLVLSTTREGADAAGVQGQLRQALETALAEARKAAKPGQVEVSTGAFSLYPRYANPVPGSGSANRAIAGWMGSTELVIQGRDTATIAQLAGRIQTLSIARVGFSLSREAREAVDGDVTAQAIARFRKQADAVTRQFGFHDYTVREVAVSGNDAAVPGPVPVMRVQAMRAPAEEALPVEAGKALVTATVSGSVQMK